MARKIVLAIFITIFCGVSITYASSLFTLSDTVSRHAPSIASDHTINFGMHEALDLVGSNFYIEFASGFNLTTITTADIDLSFGPVTGLENSLNLISGVPNATDWGMVISGQQIIFTHPTNALNGDIASNSFVNINIGIVAGGVNQIVNPATLGSTIIRFNTSNNEYGALAVPITEDQVGTSGNVGNPSVIVQWAVPQQRVGVPETNDDAQFYLTVRSASDLENTINYTSLGLLNLNTDGTYLIPELLSVSGGTYDVGIKTQQHLTKILDDISLPAGATTTLNFSDINNLAPKGVEILLAGDINNTGISPATLGDDVVNSVDLSTLLNVIDDDDVTGNVIRANLNQDIVVNSVDISLMIQNLDKEGDR